MNIENECVKNAVKTTVNLRFRQSVKMISVKSTSQNILKPIKKTFWIRLDAPSVQNTFKNLLKPNQKTSFWIRLDAPARARR